MDYPSLDARTLQRGISIPLHEQISNHFRTLIKTGKWPVHYKLHSEANLGIELRVNRGTVRRAIRTLIDEGLVEQVQGKGTFVTSSRIEPSFGPVLYSMAEELHVRGINFESELLHLDKRIPSAQIARYLDIPVGQTAWYIKRVRRRVEGAPLMVLQNWVNIDACADIRSDDLSKQGLFHILEESGNPVVIGRRTVVADNADTELASLLGIEVGIAVLHIEQTTYSENDKPIEFSDIWFPSSQLTLNTVLSRPQAQYPPSPHPRGLD